MLNQLFIGLSIPFLGTALGAAMCFFMKQTMNPKLQKALTGFAAGIMTAASFWSLLEPAIEQSQYLKRLSFIPAGAGFLIGIAFMLLLDNLIPHMHMNTSESEGPDVQLKKTTKLLFAVTLHNIPEGMTVGVVYAGWLSKSTTVTFAAALSLAIGIGIQNFPEGAIISMPLRENGYSRTKAFLLGTLSGAVEPVGAIITLLFSSVVVAILPVLLGFAAGAMIYVVVEELIPGMSAGKHSNIATVVFMLGFVLMMSLDTALG